MDTKALKLAAIAATMLDDFSPTTWTSLPPLDAGVRILISDGETDY
ncbi:aminoglycoside phosphotransferase, partial [Burkholderia multivorans]